MSKIFDNLFGRGESLEKDPLAPPRYVYEKASWFSALALPAYMLLLLGIGLFFFQLHRPLIAVAAILLGFVPSFALVLLAWRSVNKIFGRKPARWSDCTYGPYLDEDGERILALHERCVTPIELAEIEAHRQKEAQETFDWFSELEKNAVSFQRQVIQSEDGIDLVAYMLQPHTSTKRWALYVHGIATSWRSGMSFAHQLSARGFNLCFVQQRAHGESGGELVGFSELERRDVVAWAEYLIKTQGEDIEILIMGSSLGAASVLAACGEEDLPRQVKLCVEDAGFTDAWNELLYDFRSTAGFTGSIALNPHPIADLIRLFFKLKHHRYDIGIQARPVDAVKRSRIPILFIHGQEDDKVPAFMMDDLYEAALSAPCKDHKKILVPGAGHCVSVFADPDLFWSAVDEMVSRSFIRLS